MSTLDDKINEHFAGFVVRKDLVKAVKGNAIVPTYVLEYLLGQYCATDDEASIETGIETVKEILRKHYVHRSEAGLIQSTIKEKGRYKVIDQISVSLNEKTDSYEATFRTAIEDAAREEGFVVGDESLASKSFLAVLNSTVFWYSPREADAHHEQHTIARQLVSYALRGLGARVPDFIEKDIMQDEEKS